jgi:hypothetical protein
MFPYLDYIRINRQTASRLFYEKMLITMQSVPKVKIVFLSQDKRLHIT